MLAISVHICLPRWLIESVFHIGNSSVSGSMHLKSMTDEEETPQLYCSVLMGA